MFTACAPVTSPYLWSAPHRRRMAVSPSKELTASVRRRIRELRDERGMTQEELCKRAGISSDSVSRLEGGSRKPGLGTLERIAKAFGVPLTALFEGAPPPSERVVPASMRRVATLLETQPSDVLALAENVVNAVVRAYGAGTAMKPPSDDATVASPKGRPRSARGAKRAGSRSRTRGRTP